MRVVENVEEFEDQMSRASSEALNAFGDGSVLSKICGFSPSHRDSGFGGQIGKYCVSI